MKTGTTSSKAHAGRRPKDYNAKLKVLVDLTLLHASSMRKVTMAFPERFTFPDDIVSKNEVVTEISLNGMAELQNDRKCDQCLRTLLRGMTVLGKGVTTRYLATGGSFFSPTCISCFMEDRGGYYSTALAALVMET